jgi:hypothetical protein
MAQLLPRGGQLRFDVFEHSSQSLTSEFQWESKFKTRWRKTARPATKRFAPNKGIFCWSKRL